MPYRVRYTSRAGVPGELWYMHEGEASNAAHALKAAGCAPEVWLASVMDLPRELLGQPSLCLPVPSVVAMPDSVPRFARPSKRARPSRR